MDGWLRLGLIGELDRWSAQMLDDRLARLRAVKSPVRLDLSALQFIDSSGLLFLARTVQEARRTQWPLEVERDVAPEVMRVFRLVNLDSYVWGWRRAGRVAAR